MGKKNAIASCGSSRTIAFHRAVTFASNVAPAAMGIARVWGRPPGSGEVGASVEDERLSGGEPARAEDERALSGDESTLAGADWTLASAEWSWVEEAPVAEAVGDGTKGGAEREPSTKAPGGSPRSQAAIQAKPITHPNATIR
jgi:hypothetical protein